MMAILSYFMRLRRVQIPHWGEEGKEGNVSASLQVTWLFVSVANHLPKDTLLVCSRAVVLVVVVV